MKTDNELIAEFMRFVDGGDFWSSNGKHPYRKDDYSHRFYPSELMFDELWEWIIPVVKKIKVMPIEEFQRKKPVMNAVIDLDIEEINTAVVDFIKWYNQLKSNQQSPNS